MTCPLTFTEKALQMLKDARNDEDGFFVRVGVRGGGCNGFTRIFEMTKKADLKDFIFEIDSLLVFIDPISIQYLKGTAIDYEIHGLNAGFTFKSETSKNCGCGKSFSA